MPAVPKDAKKPEDRKAAKAESERKSIEIDYDGAHYTITREAVDNLELWELIEDGNSVTAVRGMLGAKQWAAFKDAHRSESGTVTMDEFEKFLNHMMEAIGGN